MRSHRRFIPILLFLLRHNSRLLCVHPSLWCYLRRSRGQRPAVVKTLRTGSRSQCMLLILWCRTSRLLGLHFNLWCCPRRSRGQRPAAVNIPRTGRALQHTSRLLGFHPNLWHRRLQRHHTAVFLHHRAQLLRRSPGQCPAAVTIHQPHSRRQSILLVL
jgi:hypothetical protein